MAANTTSNTRGSRRPDIRWLVKLAKALRNEGVSSVELPGVRLTLYPPSPAAAMPVPAQDPGRPEGPKADPSEPYLASGMLPVNIRELRAKREAAGK